VICVETRHMQAVLKAQINKTDRNDARGMAQMMRVGLYRPVHEELLILAAPSRARGARAGRPRRIGRGCAEQPDRLEPPGRRCGCWPTSPIPF
jgi:hypothetical protein